MALVFRLQTFLEKENNKNELASAYFFYNDKKDKKNYFF